MTCLFIYLAILYLSINNTYYQVHLLSGDTLSLHGHPDKLL